MNPAKPFMIGPVKDGVRKDLRPISIPEDSFETLEDMYVFRGRVRRRVGYELLGRLAQRFTTSALGNVAGPGTTAFNIYALIGISDPGVSIIPGTITISVAAPGSYTIIENLDFSGKLIASAGVGFTGGTINYNTGALSLTFSAGFAASAITITFSLAINTPAMGISTRELSGINNEDTIVFSPKYSFIYDNVLQGFDILPSTMQTTWNGTNSDFFYTTNYQGGFWATNNIAGMHYFSITNITNAANAQVTAAGNIFQIGDPVFFNEVQGMTQINGLTGTVTIAGNPFTVSIDTTAFGVYGGGGIVQSPRRIVTGAGDGIRYYTGGTWVNFAPPIQSDQYLQGCLILIPYRGYLVALNTKEGPAGNNVNYPQRARYSQLGTVYYTSPVPTNQTIDSDSWRDDIFGRGGAIDAPTSEQIIGAQFVKDILIVFFERSSWRLRFTQNEIIPFVWERINVEFGAESTFSLVPFDKGTYAVGNRGIVICDGYSTNRVDIKIPDLVFEFENENLAIKRVHGIRTFESKLVYWCYPDSMQNALYPNRLLVYNYEQDCWAIFKDSFTCFGNWQSSNDRTWANSGDIDWASADFPWNSGQLQAQYEQIIGGNQQGYVEKMEFKTQNDASLFISSLTAASPGIFTSPDHNLETLDWVKINKVAGILNSDGTSLNQRNYRVSKEGLNTFHLQEFEPFSLGTSLAASTSFTETILSPWAPFYAYSVEVSMVDSVTGAVITLKDFQGDGILNTDPVSSTIGTVNYSSGLISLSFSALANNTNIIARVIGNQNLVNVNTIVDSTTSGGVVFNPTGYYGGGEISKINGINVKTKYFNFFPQGQKSRVKWIDFYTDTTDFGEFTADIYIDGNTSQPMNVPVSNNPNSNVVLTKPYNAVINDSDNQIYRFYCETSGQTHQLGLRLKDQQMAHNIINQSDIDIPSIIFWARPGGRIV